MCVCVCVCVCVSRGPGSSVGIATKGWTVRDKISVGTRFSACPDRPWGRPSLLYNSYRVFHGGRCGPGLRLNPTPHLVPMVLEKSRAIPLLTLRACVAYKKGENLPTSIRVRLTVPHCYAQLLGPVIHFSFMKPIPNIHNNTTSF